jgi:hypothetical protein
LGYFINMFRKSATFHLAILCFSFLQLVSLSSHGAVAFRSKSYATSTGSSVTPTEPAGAAQNDILFMFFILGNTAPTITPPTGWSTLHSFATTNGVAIRLFWIRRGASAPSYAVSWGSSFYYEVSVTAWSGAITSGNPYDVSATSGVTSRNPPNPDCPSVTTTVANTMVIAFGMSWSGWMSGGATAPAGYTGADLGAQATDLAIAYKSKAAIGAEDPAAYSGTQFNSTDAVAEITVALKPPTSTSRVRHRINSD